MHQGFRLSIHSQWKIYLLLKGLEARVRAQGLKDRLTLQEDHGAIVLRIGVLKVIEEWCARRDSNSRPIAPEAIALSS